MNTVLRAQSRHLPRRTQALRLAHRQTMLTFGLRGRLQDGGVSWRTDKKDQIPGLLGRMRIQQALQSGMIALAMEAGWSHPALVASRSRQGQGTSRLKAYDKPRLAWHQVPHGFVHRFVRLISSEAMAMHYRTALLEAEAEANRETQILRLT